MKILISGGKGQLGIDCSTVLYKYHDIVSLGLRELDITDMYSAEKVVQEVMPDIILNCAAFSNADDCETNRDLANKANAKGPKNLACIAQKYELKLIHISTDYVFDGKRKVPQPYTEKDQPCPVSYYGITKLAGEKAVQSETDNYVIVRTAWLYGLNGHNFLKTILRKAIESPERQIRVVNDQFGSPTRSYTLARQIEKLIEINSNGIYHASSEGYCSWHEFAGSFLKEMGVPYSLVPCSSKEYPTPASRPANSILKNQRLNNAGINIMGNWKIDLKRFVSKFRVSLIDEAKGVIR
jgi:dTDP-4-dehydrorhamnose reductase